MPDTYITTSYRHAEQTINDWCRTTRPADRKIGPPGYLIEIRGTFYVHPRLDPKGRNITIGDWQAVLGCWFRERAYSIALTENAKYEATEDILLFFPAAPYELRLTWL